MCSLQGFCRVTQTCTVNRLIKVRAELDLRAPQSTDKNPGECSDRPDNSPKFIQLAGVPCHTITLASPSREWHSFCGNSKLLFEFARTSLVIFNVWSISPRWTTSPGLAVISLAESGAWLWEVTGGGEHKRGAWEGLCDTFNRFSWKVSLKLCFFWNTYMLSTFEEMSGLHDYLKTLLWKSLPNLQVS